MKTYQKDFLNFAIARGVLKFGEYTLKSGRVSPYFFNAGLFQTGSALSRLGKFYAQAIVESGQEFDMLFGPAYKGIPLAAATAIALYEHHGRDYPYAFNRKEAKAVLLDPYALTRDVVKQTIRQELKNNPALT